MLFRSNPPDGYSMVNFHVGDAVHDLVQTAIINKWPEAQTECEGLIGDFLSGHCDVLYRAEDGDLVVCEIKSTADFAFEKATGAELKSNGRWRKKEKEPPEGPKREHKLQAGIYAQMLGASYVAIVYVRKTAALGEPVTWEWRFTADELSDATEAEIARLRGIVEDVRAGWISPREFEGEIIERPEKTKWPCLYCSFRDACVQLGAGAVEVK